MINLFTLQNKEIRIRIFLNFIIIGICLIDLGKKKVLFEETSLFERTLINVFSPLQEAISQGKIFIKHSVDDYIANSKASKENRFLLHQILELEKELFSANEVQLENNRLRQLLQFGEELQVKKVLAQVVSWDGSSDYKVLRINKGAQDGIRLQSPVVTSQGLVGHIYRLTDSYADVLTILDAGHRVDVLVQQERSHGILEGTGKSVSQLKYIPLTEKIELSDIVLTSSLGQLYPKGIRVGKITRIERESYSLTQRIEVMPSVDFSSLEEVVVFIPENEEKLRQEWEKLNEQADEDQK